MVKFSDLSVGMTVALRDDVPRRRQNELDVTDEMRIRLGEEVTIISLDDGSLSFPIFHIEEDKRFYWAVELIDHIVVEEELPTLSGDPLSFLA